MEKMPIGPSPTRIFLSLPWIESHCLRLRRERSAMLSGTERPPVERVSLLRCWDRRILRKRTGISRSSGGL
jgi:hypothetical protein